MACCIIPCCAIFTIGYCKWGVERCLVHGSMASKDWPEALPEDFRDVPRVCRLILGVYEVDIEHPRFTDRIIPQNVVKRVSFDDASQKCPPYMIYVDHEAKDVSLLMRGLRLTKASDYLILFNNRTGQQMFDGGYVHHGLLNVAIWLLETELTTLQGELAKYPDYSLTLGGHSLGSGVVSLLAILIVNNLREFPTLTRDKVNCYAVAPSRCMSMNLAIKYADVISSIVLQDDFLPRTTIPIQIIFGAAFCLPCVITAACVRETLIPQAKKLQNPQRLYSPGRLFHIVYTDNFGSCQKQKIAPIVKTAIPVGGRFENLVCSMNSTDDHSIFTVETKVAEAWELLEEAEQELLKAPDAQKMERAADRKENKAGELRAAFEEALELKVGNAFHPEEEGGNKREGGEDGDEDLPIKRRFLRAVLQRKEEERLVREEQERAEQKRREVSASERWNSLFGVLGQKVRKDFRVTKVQEVEESTELQKVEGDVGRDSKASGKWKAIALKAKQKSLNGENSGEKTTEESEAVAGQ